MEHEETRPWDQMEDEPDRDYARFRNWLRLNDRRIEKAAPHLKVKAYRAYELSTKWDWQRRAAAFDKHEAIKDHEESSRIRRKAAAVLGLAVLGTAEARLEMDDDDRDSQDLQRLTAALKNLAPNVEVSISQDQLLSRDDEVTIAVRRAREIDDDADADK